MFRLAALKSPISAEQHGKVENAINPWFSTGPFPYTQLDHEID